MKYVVSENVEIILDNKKYLLEAGDTIIIESAFVNLERTYELIAQQVAKKFKVSADQIRDGLETELFDSIKKFVREIVKQDPELNFNVNEEVVGDILDRVAMLDTIIDDWKRYNSPGNSGKNKEIEQDLQRIKRKNKEDRDNIFNQ